MNAPNNGQPLAPIVDLGVLKKQPRQLTHYRVVAVRDGGEAELGYLISGYGLDDKGHLMLIVNGQLVGTYAPGAWRAAWKADIVPEVVG